jgi:cytochrome c oxidase subunit 2
MLPEFLRPPQQGTELAGRVDELFLFSLLVAVFFSLLIAGLIFYFGLRYRRRSSAQVGDSAAAPLTIEIVWSVVPFAILLFLFYWGADVFFDLSRPPADADEYFVIGRQWMWKIQHPDGAREINELHAPVGRSIKLTMTSEDVVHSFFVPAFRVKADAIPGRYTTTWFRATEPGTYHLFCAEYCGTEHSRMIGRVIIMDAFQYESWLAQGRADRPAAASGEELFNTHGCATCHRPDSAARAPNLVGLFGRTVELRGGETLKADEEYIRESILRPAVRVVAGYPPIMPSFEGQLSEEEILQIIGYIRSMKGAQ